MTRLLTTGYETGDTAEAGTSVVGTNGVITAASSTPTPRGGAYCLKVASSSTAIAATYKTFTFAVAKTEIWTRWAVYLHMTGSSASEWVLYLDQDPAAGAQMSVTWDITSNLLRLYRGNSGTLVGTSGTALAPDGWHVLEVRHQLLTTTTGAGEVWLDGNQVITFSGDVVNTGTVSVQSVQLGILNASTISGMTGGYVAIDDVAINDVAGSINNAQPLDGRVVLLSPTGAGTTTQLVRGGTDTGANWSQVSELPPALTQYVGSATIGERDLYALANLGVSVASINVVEAILLAQNSDAGGGSLTPTVKSGATTNEATAVGLTTSSAYITGRWETDPNTTAAWTSAAVDALEAGATVR